MEGISQEAASIAGHFGLGKLVVCYDDNRITIDGSTTISFDGENHAARLEADGWHVQRVEDSEDLDALRGRAGGRARRSRAPVLHRDPLAHRLPRAQRVDTAASHGSALGEDEVRATKEAMGFDPDRHFWVDERVYEHMSLRDSGAKAHGEWQERFEAWREASPELAADWDLAWAGRLRDGWRETLPKFEAGEKLATRAAGQQAMAAFACARPDDDRRRGRSGRVDEDPVRGRRRVLEGPRRAQHAVRHPRARDGRDRQRRRRPRRDRLAVRLDVPDVLRLHARRRCGCRR